jgi:hypothetical protein
MDDVSCVCGRRFRISGRAHGRAMTCPACGGVLKTPSLDATVDGASSKRSWWRDPIVLTTVVLCGLILTSALLFWRARERQDEFRLRVHLFRWSGDLLLSEKPREALEMYRRAIDLIQQGGGGDPRLQTELAEVQAKVDQIRAESGEPIAQAEAVVKNSSPKRETVAYTGRAKKFSLRNSER